MYLSLSYLLFSNDGIEVHLLSSDITLCVCLSSVFLQRCLIEWWCDVSCCLSFLNYALVDFGAGNSCL